MFPEGDFNNQNTCGTKKKRKQKRTKSLSGKKDDATAEGKESPSELWPLYLVGTLRPGKPMGGGPADTRFRQQFRSAGNKQKRREASILMVSNTHP